MKRISSFRQFLLPSAPVYLSLAAGLTLFSACPSSAAPRLPVSASLPAQSAKPADDTPDATLLDPAKTIDREIAGGQKQSYDLPLEAGQYVSITVDQRGIDLAIDLYDPARRLLVSFAYHQKRFAEEKVEFVAEASATYRLVVRPSYFGSPAARYRLKVNEIRSANETDRALFQTLELCTEADVFYDKGQYDDSVRAGSAAVAAAEKTSGRDELLLAQALIKLGLATRMKGDIDATQKAFQRAIDIRRKILGEEDPQTARAIGDMGLVFDLQHAFVDAAAYYQKAIDITDRTLGPDDPQSATFLMDLAIAYGKRGNFENVVTMYQRALAISEKMLGPDDQFTFKVCYNLGDAYLDMHRNDEAEVLMKRALGIVERKYGPDHPNAAYPLQNLGIIARGKKQYDQALEYLWRAEKLREKAVGRRNPVTASLLVNIGNVYHAKGDYQKGIELFEQALEILESTGSTYNSATMITLANLARTYAAQGDAVRSGEYQARLDQSMEKRISYNLAIGSEKDKLAYIDTVSELTNRSVSTNIRELPRDKNSTENAATALLQRKGRVLDSLAQGVSSLRQHLNPEDRKLLDKLGATTTELAQLSLSGPKKTPLPEYQKQLLALERERENLEAEVSLRSKGYYESTDHVTLAAVRSAIPDDSALIEFVVYSPFSPKAVNDHEANGEPRYAAYVISPHGVVRVVDLGSAKEIDDAISKLRETLADPGREEVTRLARALDQRVMEPVRALVGDASHLLISPDGELNLIPFEALVDEHQKFLVENFSISYLTTGRDLLRLQVARKSQSGPLVVANPLFGEPGQTLAAQAGTSRQNLADERRRRRSITTAEDLSGVYFAPLPGTGREARAIQSLFPASEILTGTAATKSRLMQVNAPSILHIATHGFFLEDLSAARNPGTPSASGKAAPAEQTRVKIANPLLRAGFALTGANLTKDSTADGILTGLEASGLNLWGTKLVTLSACETAVGTIKNGEGVYGLRRAFFLAGTETLVMSLWEVSDQTTQEMMTSYYSGLKRGLGRGEALRSAQLALLKRRDLHHPFYWASFIQAGEWGNLDGKRSPGAH
ncbi:MAG TPA: CHAT domain-containing tetratricopeptide repeat protein [Candidatus Saccharimonadales bacterium]|nr:CHAT domain-containing tetratricopeptide repeat protein [Candidatus Saccharimonadales bacterium]